jgi:peptidoglycan/xylan/chitin deacetylase (PgdA/CDA1 family)
MAAVNPWLIGAPVAAATAVGGLAYAAFHPRSEFFGKHIHATNCSAKLAITFDDGPNPSITPKLLALLDQYNARATFFVVGKFVRDAPDLLREIIARGHSIGNHTETHPNLSLAMPSRVRGQLEDCNGAISEVLGSTPAWFRPPFGLRNPWVIPIANKLGMQAVMWTLLPGDWRAPSAEWLIPRLQPIATRAVKNSDGRGNFRENIRGDLLCLHDGYHRHQNGDRRHTLKALQYWFPRWRDLGLKFVTIDEAVR